MKENFIYFKQSIKNGTRYGYYSSDELTASSILLDVFECYLDFTTGHYTFISHVERIDPLFDDLIEISVDEYNHFKKLYNDYNILTSQLDEEYLKFYNHVY